MACNTDCCGSVLFNIFSGKVTLDSHNTLCLPLLELRHWVSCLCWWGAPEKEMVAIRSNIYRLLTLCPVTVLGCIIYIILFNPHNSSLRLERLCFLTRILRWVVNQLVNDLYLCYLDLNLGVLHNHCYSISLVVISESQDITPWISAWIKDQNLLFGFFL